MMTARQVSSTILKTTLTPPSFFLPAFASSIWVTSIYALAGQTRSSSSSVARSFSTSTPVEAAARTARDASASTPHSGQDISNQLSEIVGMAEGRRRGPGYSKTSAHTPARGTLLAERQGELAAAMGLRSSDRPHHWGFSRDRPYMEAAPLPVRLDPFVGRAETVTPQLGLGAALRRLDVKCMQNKVRNDFFRQRFHERAGLKRKRLKSERWRRRFKEGFKATVAKVDRMRRKGW